MVAHTTLLEISCTGSIIMIQGDHLGVCLKAKLYFDTIAYHETIITIYHNCKYYFNFLLNFLNLLKSRPLIIILHCFACG